MLRVTDKPAAGRIVHDAEWLPYTFDPSGRSLVFARVPEEVRRSAPFLDSEAIRSCELALLPQPMVEKAAETVQTVPVHFIFHTALCGSTMLMRAINETGSATGIREPAILLNLYHRMRTGSRIDEAHRLDLVLRLLARPFGDRAAVVIKPSCFVNPLVSDLLSHASGSRAVLLRSHLRAFLLGIAKGGPEARTWSRQVFADLQQALPLDLGIDGGELTGLQAAGLVWLMRVWLFSQISSEHGPERALPVHADTVFADPVAAVSEISHFFGLPASGSLSDLHASGVFQWHSKETGRQFGTADRSRELEATRAAHGAQVETTARWVEELAAQRGIRLSK